MLGAWVLALAQADTLPSSWVDTFGARCLSGAAPTFEVAVNTSNTKWVLFLEGGGWCYGATANATKKSCAGRARGVWPPTADGVSLGSSSEKDAGVPSDIGGIMAQDCALNPQFCAWNKIFLHYCDGASFGGGRVDPIPITTGLMYLRGRNIFDAIIDYATTAPAGGGLGMGAATEVILSGGSAGGLAVFYNLDHLAALLPKSVRLTGFPDAGFFNDALDVTGVPTYRNNFIGADPVWNVTGSGGTNAKCLAAQAPGEAWKCLMAQYIAPHIVTPLFVMNSLYDAWQMSNVLNTPCIPTAKPGATVCTAATNASMLAFRTNFIALLEATVIGENAPGAARNGVYADGCYVHEQNVNYCEGQNMPNCVGWSPNSSGSKKWGYTTSVAVADGRTLTPQEAFLAWYNGDRVAGVAIDSANPFFNNPSCIYRGVP